MNGHDVVQRSRKRKLTENGSGGGGQHLIGSSSSSPTLSPMEKSFDNNNGTKHRRSNGNGQQPISRVHQGKSGASAGGALEDEEDYDEETRYLVLDDGTGEQLTVGDVVWARLSCRAPWWPAAIIDPRMCGYELNDRVWVFWLGDNRISDVDKPMVKNLAENFNSSFRNGGSQNYMTSVKKAIEIHAKRIGQSANEDPIEWALTNFSPSVMNTKPKRGDNVHYGLCLPNNCNDALPDFIVARLQEIRELQESKLSGESSDESGDDGDDEEDEQLLLVQQKQQQQQPKQQQRQEPNVRPLHGNSKLARMARNVDEEEEEEEEDKNSDTSDTNESGSTSPKNNPNANKKEQRAARRQIVHERPLTDFCLCCGSMASLSTSHPMFDGKMCKGCCNWYKEVCFVYDQDGKKEHCAVCGCGGSLLICDNNNCTNVFCKDCIVTLVSEEDYNRILETDPWSCYVCTGRPAGLMRPKKDWENNVFGLFKTSNILDEVDLSLIPKEKRPIRVLSLFDGVGTGKLVLDELGMDIGAYYCSEVDEDATLVTRVNHPKQISYLGDVRYVDLEKLKEISPIDVLIGGSPCNDISIANPKRRGLYDPEGTGILFFEYYRILQSLLQINAKEGRNLFWIYENVASMREQYRSVINRFLGRPPALFDSCHFSAQNRARYFWGNIPGMYNNMAPTAQNRSPIVEDILTQNCGRIAKMDKVRTVTTRTNSLKQGRTFSVCPVTQDGRPDTLWPTELETLFGLPRHYTDVGSLSPTKRQKLIGQGWTVPVVKHIMRPLQRFYKTKDGGK